MSMCDWPLSTLCNFYLETLEKYFCWSLNNVNDLLNRMWRFVVSCKIFTSTNAPSRLVHIRNLWVWWVSEWVSKHKFWCLRLRLYKCFLELFSYFIFLWRFAFNYLSTANMDGFFFFFDWIRFHTEKAKERKATKPKHINKTKKTQKQQHADTKRALSLV